MSRPDRMQELAAILADEAAAATELQDALFAERRALAAVDDDALTQATARKTTALATLESAEVRRRRQLRDISPTLASGDMQSLLERLIGDATASSSMDSIRRNWEQVRRTLQQCRAVNEANGQVVTALQRQVQQALNLLRGGRGHVATYGPTGSAQFADVGARELARA
jgi:flagellar biosynthesis/type III secretory pathway chaperone